MDELNANGFVILDRHILHWRWYTVPKTAHLYIHLVLRANHDDWYFLGNLVRRGELITSLPHLSRETGLSESEVRTALKHLVRSGDISYRVMPFGRLITLTNYDRDQRSLREDPPEESQPDHSRSADGPQPDHSRIADGSQPDHSRGAGGSQQTTIYNKDNKENKKNKKNKGACGTPTLDEVRKYAREAGLCLNADRFFNHYASIGWVRNGNAISDWKALARLWAEEDRKKMEKAAPRDDGLDCWGKPIKKEFE